MFATSWKAQCSATKTESKVDASLLTLTAARISGPNNSKRT